MMSCAGDSAPICEQIDQYVVKKQIHHDGGWKYFDESGLYDSVESRERNVHSDIYWHKNDVSKRIFYSQFSKLTHLVRDRNRNVLLVIDRSAEKLIRLNLDDCKDGEKNVSGYPVLARIPNAWQLCVNSNDDRQVVVCLSTVKIRPQTITFISNEVVEWQEEFNEYLMQACVLNVFDIVLINDSMIMKISSVNGRRIKMIRSGFDQFKQANGICSVPNGGFLVSDEYNRRIYSFNNDLHMMKVLNLDFRPTDIYISCEAEMFVARGKRKPYVSFIYHLPKERK